ncbi:hypothetical protein J4Q44_G00295950 [Coregonus suidteri]|uniref:Uncharacterized protein n=1 Tax=Coregonus suidteri TaxID=861788 RepID=A0AAN8KXY7_9TELE
MSYLQRPVRDCYILCVEENRYKPGESRLKKAIAEERQRFKGATEDMMSDVEMDRVIHCDLPTLVPPGS